MVTIEELLKIGKENGASDVHITVGLPPEMRVNGELMGMDYPRLTPTDTEEIVGQLLNEKQKNIIKEYGEADFSFQYQALDDTGLMHLNSVEALRQQSVW